MATVYLSRRNRVAILLLFLMSIAFLIWPIDRAFLNIEIDYNEGWNAYYADAAMGRMPLYPPRDQLITNNYPPLSFYVVGFLGRYCHDPIVSGRILSLVSVLVIGLGTFVSLKQFAATTASALVGSLFFIATMGRFFTNYVGMNDPHLFAQSLMTWGFVLFLRAQRRNGPFLPAILVMVLAGFVKHNLIVIPLSCLIAAGMQNRRAMFTSALFAALAIAAGLGACFLAYGNDFFANLLLPRVNHWKEPLSSLGHLQWVAVGLITWCYAGFALRAEPHVRTINLLVGIGLASFLLQKAGDGVSYNAQFELVFAVSLGVGMTLTHAEKLPIAGRFSPNAIRFTLLLAILIRLLASGRTEPVRVLFDRNLHAEIAERERAMAETIDHYRNTPHAIGMTSMASYRAGTPYLFDPFTTSQRVAKGQLTAESVKSKLEKAPFVVVSENQLLRWTTPYRQ